MYDRRIIMIGILVASNKEWAFVKEYYKEENINIK